MELRPPAAAPGVGLQPPGEVEPGAAGAGEQFAEGRAGGAEGDGLEPPAGAVGERQGEVAFADRAQGGAPSLAAADDAIAQVEKLLEETA